VWTGRIAVGVPLLLDVQVENPGLTTRGELRLRSREGWNGEQSRKVGTHAAIAA